jgi:hypothetical protein
MSKVLEVYTEGETVLIKAIVTKVHIDKDRVTYSLKDGTNNVPYQNRFAERDILPFLHEGSTEETEEKESEEDGIQL